MRHHSSARRRYWAAAGVFVVLGLPAAHAVDIPLDAITPARIGYIDLQRVFDTYPEKSFAEGDLLREIEKRRRELGQRQNLINVYRQQIANDEAALAQARAGQPVIVPANTVPEPVAPPTPAPAASTSTVTSSTAPVPVEPYPLEDPLAGLPGHETSPAATEQAKAAKALPGMQEAKPKSVLDKLAESSAPSVLAPDAVSALEKRVADHRQGLERTIAEFKNFRTHAVGDMKVLQTQKTHGVMAKIYATLQDLAREEGVSVILDKAYVLYGEEGVDLSEKLVQRLQADSL